MLERDISDLPTGEVDEEQPLVVDLSPRKLKMRWREVTLRLWKLHDELDRVESVGVKMGLGDVKGWVGGQFGPYYEEFTIGKGLPGAEHE